MTDLAALRRLNILHSLLQMRITFLVVFLEFEVAGIHSSHFLPLPAKQQGAIKITSATSNIILRELTIILEHIK